MNPAVPFDWDQQFKPIRARCGRNGAVKFPNLRGEIRAGHQVRLLCRSLLHLDAVYPSASLRPELQHIESLADVQRAARAIGLPPVIVEDAVSDVRMLLHLAQEHARSDCVRASRRNEEGISGLDRKSVV